MKAVSFTDEEIKKYGISNEEADRIVNVIKIFATEIYSQKQNGAWSNVKRDFPSEAMKYNRNK